MAKTGRKTSTLGKRFSGFSFGEPVALFRALYGKVPTEKAIFSRKNFYFSREHVARISGVFGLKGPKNRQIGDFLAKNRRFR